MAKSPTRAWLPARARRLGNVAPTSSGPGGALDAGPERWPRWLSGTSLLVLAVPFSFFGLSAAQLSEPEGRLVQASVEMLRSGKLLSHQLYGRPLPAAPPLNSWAIAAPTWVMGRTSEFSARLHSALAATGGILILSWIVGRSCGRSAGWAAAAAALASWVGIEKSIQADGAMMFSCWIVAALALFYRGHEPARGRAWPWTLGAYACLAAACLTAGPAALLLFDLTIVLFALIQGRWRSLLSWEHWAGHALLLALCGSWLAAVFPQAGWPGVRAMLTPAHLEVLAACTQLPIALAACLPWLLFGFPALSAELRAGLSEPARKFLTFLLCWSGGGTVAWISAALLGLASESLALLELPVAALAGIVWAAWLANRLPPRWDRFHSAAALGSLVLGGLTLSACGLYALNALPYHRPVAGALVGSALLLSVFGIRAARAGLRLRVFAALLGLGLVVKLGYVEIVLAERNFRRPEAAYGRALGQRIPAGAVLHIFHPWPPSTLFYAQRAIVLHDDPSQIRSEGGPQFWLLSQEEWGRWSRRAVVQQVDRLEDARGKPYVIARVLPLGRRD